MLLTAVSDDLIEIGLRGGVTAHEQSIATFEKKTSRNLTIMTIKELNHVAIYVTDIKRSSEFYGGVLRLQPLPRPAFNFPGAWFRLGTRQELHLIGNRGVPFVPTHHNNHFALQVDDLEAWQRHLQKERATFAPKQQRPDGAWQVFLQDPDGHAIELFTPPSAEDGPERAAER